MKHIIQIFFLLIPFCGLSAQQLAQAASKPSPPPALNPSTEYFVGLIDDAYQVTVSLLCEGGRCNGELMYTESGVNFQLEGVQFDNRFLLQEIDEQQAVSGFINATQNNGSIEGEWSNFDGSIGSKIQLQKVEDKEVISNATNDKWVKIYRGIILWDEVQMILHHLGQGQVFGSIYYTSQDEEEKIVGQIDQQGKLNLTIANDASMNTARLIERETNDNGFRAEFTNPDGQKNYSSFELKKQIPVAYIEYADYVMSYEVLYPQYTNTTFNNWVQDYIKNWIKRCRTQVKAIKENYPVCEPQARSSERAYIWFEIDEIHNDLLVGSFFFSNTWNNHTSGLPINFDLKTGKPITEKNLLKKNDKTFKEFKNKYISNELKRHPKYMDSDYRAWVNKESFPLFTLQNNGIQYSTNYDEIYGQAKVTIPYEKLKPYLKTNTPINKFF